MVTLDYNKYTDRFIRENPSNEHEEQLAEQIAEKEAQGFIDRCKTDKFTMRAVEKLLRKVSSKRQAAPDNIDLTPRQSEKSDIANNPPKDNLL